MKDSDDIRILVHTQPRKVPSISKKKPDVMEIALSGKLEEKFEYAKNLLGREISVEDVFAVGQFVDVSAITKGKGIQGPVKRFGVKIRKRKHRVAKGRHIGTLGDRGTQTPWYVPMAGQTGYHQRCEYNKKILNISSDDINPKGGFVNYGLVRNQYLLVKGTIPGPKKRLIRLRQAVRPTESPKPAEITYISLESKQGR